MEGYALQWMDKALVKDERCCLSIASWLLSVPATCSVYIRNESSRSMSCVASVRKRLQTKLVISPSHSILTQGQPVLAFTFVRMAG